MHFRWDSNVARDISNELDRLEEELGECAVDMDRCATILLDMAGGTPDELIEKYTSLTSELKKGLKRMEERFNGTSRSIARASELFDSAEQELCRRAKNEGDSPSVFVWGAGSFAGTIPLFYNIPGMATVTPAQGNVTPHNAPWPALRGISQTVVVDQAALGSDMIAPPWLQGIFND